jgi:hypothetical protein
MYELEIYVSCLNVFLVSSLLRPAGSFGEKKSGDSPSDRREKEETSTPRSSAPSFGKQPCLGWKYIVLVLTFVSFLLLKFLAGAFGGEPTADVSPLASPNVDSVIQAPATPKTEESATAFGAAKNKRVSGLLSKYMEKATKEALPGDSIKLQTPKSPHSRKLSFSPSPAVTPINSRSLSLTNVDTNLLPDYGSIRAKFEDTANSSESNVFEFGEAFRQKQRFSQLIEKEKTKEAFTGMRGFNDMMFSQEKGGNGEIDDSNIGTTFVFEGTSADLVALHDGTCKVDYKSADYKGLVFVVHRTRGK